MAATDPDEYAQAIIRAAKKAYERSILEDSLVAGIEALERGEGSEMTAEDWQRLRDGVRQRHGNPDAS